MAVHHVGKILIPEKCILRWLQYEGGRIHHLGHSEEYLDYVVVVEHPDLPEVEEGGMLPLVNAAFYWEDIYRVEPRIHTIRGKIHQSIRWLRRIWFG